MPSFFIVYLLNKQKNSFLTKAKAHFCIENGLFNMVFYKIFLFSYYLQGVIFVHIRVGKSFKSDSLTCQLPWKEVIAGTL